MDKKQRERILRYLQLWERLHNVDLTITDSSTSLKGKYKRFTGKRKVRIYLEKSQMYELDMTDIVEAEFTKVIGLVYAISIKDSKGNEIFINPVLEQQHI